MVALMRMVILIAMHRHQPDISAIIGSSSKCGQSFIFQLSARFDFPASLFSEFSMMKILGKVGPVQNILFNY